MVDGLSDGPGSVTEMKFKNISRHFLQSQLMRLVAGSNSVLKMSNENVGSYFNRNYLNIPLYQGNIKPMKIC